MGRNETSWSKIKTLPPGHITVKLIQSLYGEYFTFESRYALGSWIEEQPWGEMHSNNAHRLVLALVAELRRVAAMTQDQSSRNHLEKVASMCHARFAVAPEILVSIIKACLNGEKQIIQEHENAWHRIQCSLSQTHISNTDIASRFETVNFRTRELEVELRNIERDQEELVVRWQESSHYTSVIKELQNYNPLDQPDEEVAMANSDMLAKLSANKQCMDLQLDVSGQKMVAARRTWLNKHIENITDISALQKTVLDDELVKWKRSQQLAGNGGVLNGNLDQIQEWCETLAELIWRNREQVQKIEFLCAKLFLKSTDSIAEQIAGHIVQITKLLSTLITSTFIIEKQPPQVMKTNTRFSSVVRLLIVDKLNVHLTKPKVSVELLSEAQAKKFYNNEPYEKSGEITLNSDGKMELVTSNMHQPDMAPGQMVVNFRNMKLLNRGLKRAEKKGTDMVMDEKFALLYKTHFSIADLKFKVLALSLPVIVISHGVQETNSIATIIWDNAFAKLPRAPFIVSDSEPWHRIAEVLSSKHKSIVGHELSKDALHFLAGKAFRHLTVANYDYHHLTWKQFCKDHLPGCNFTFWEWFYAILKTIQDRDQKSKDKERKAAEKLVPTRTKQLREISNDGHLMGFISRKATENLLLNCPIGTFLLRYSDSVLGGIVVAWVGENTESGRPEVFMLQPFTSRDLAVRSLADCINDLKNIHYLYPNIPKDEAFGKYYSDMDLHPITTTGYVKRCLALHIPGMNTGMDSGQSSRHSEPISPPAQSKSVSSTISSYNQDYPMAESFRATFKDQKRARLTQDCELISVVIAPRNEIW